MGVTGGLWVRHLHPPSPLGLPHAPATSPGTGSYKGSLQAAHTGGHFLPVRKGEGPQVHRPPASVKDTVEQETTSDRPDRAARL